MAQYQMSYGFDNEGQSKPTMPEPEPDPAAQEEAAKKAKLVRKQTKYLHIVVCYISLMSRSFFLKTVGGTLSFP